MNRRRSFAADGITKYSEQNFVELMEILLTKIFERYFFLRKLSLPIQKYDSVRPTENKKHHEILGFLAF